MKKILKKIQVLLFSLFLIDSDRTNAGEIILNSAEYKEALEGFENLPPEKQKFTGTVVKYLTYIAAAGFALIAILIILTELL